jgi:hypothetical protein
MTFKRGVGTGVLVNGENLRTLHVRRMRRRRRKKNRRRRRRRSWRWWAQPLRTFLPLTVIGAISRAKTPAFWAAAQQA